MSDAVREISATLPRWPDWTEVRLFRGVVRAFLERDIRVRYRQTFLGAAWILAYPLLAAGTFTVIFGRLAHLSSGGGNYFVYTFAGMTVWSAVSATFMRSATSIIGNGGVVTKVYFPRILLPVATWAATLVDAAISILALIVCSLLAGETTWWVLLLPVFVVLASVLGLGMGMIFCGPTVKYRDLAYILPVGIQLLLFLMPVGYGREAVPSKWLWLYDLNPIAPWIDASRHGVVGSGVPQLRYFGLSLLITAVVVVIGITRLERSTRYLADVL